MFCSWFLVLCSMFGVAFSTLQSVISTYYFGFKFVSLDLNIAKSMKSLLIIFLAVIPMTLLAQVRVYKGTSGYTSDVICNIKDGKIYSKTSGYTSDVICHVKGNKIYKGTSMYSSDVLYTVKDGKVYKGNSGYTSDIIFTIREGKLYKGTSSYSSDVMATIRDGKVYTGNSNYSSDIEFTIRGDATVEEFVGVWYAVRYGW